MAEGLLGCVEGEGKLLKGRKIIWTAGMSLHWGAELSLPFFALYEGLSTSFSNYYFAKGMIEFVALNVVAQPAAFCLKAISMSGEQNYIQARYHLKEAKNEKGIKRKISRGLGRLHLYARRHQEKCDSVSNYVGSF